MRQQSARALAYYLDELHELGGELSLAAHLAPVSAELSALADRAADYSPTRREEPYRRAITGIYSRLAKTARELDHVIALRRRSPTRRPTQTSMNSRPISMSSQHSLMRTAGRSSRAGGCAR